MAEPKQLDPETMPLEDLKALILSQEVEHTEAQEPEAKTVTTEGTVRDEKGRFASTEEKEEVQEPEAKAEEAEEEQEPEEFIFERVIDLGDGSGSQVFRGRGATREEALAALVDKLTDAQTNATKKIREYSKTVKTEATKTAQQQQDEDYVLNEEFKKNPVEAQRKIVKQELERQKADDNWNNSVASDFVNSHPEYIADPKVGNGDRLLAEYARMFPNDARLDADNLEKAYDNLNATGVLKLRQQEEQEPEVKEEVPVVPVQRTATGKKSSTLSTRGGGAPLVKGAPTEEDLYNMPLDKLREGTTKFYKEKEQS